MIQIKILKNKQQIRLIATGHAGFADYGQDIVCSAVSVLLDHTARGLTKANVIDDGSHYELTANIQNVGDQRFIDSLIETLTLIAGSYPKNLTVMLERVQRVR